ncbi:hypothetical protein RQP46_000983 [Phenoliferia psychrophenolica]
MTNLLDPIQQHYKISFENDFADLSHALSSLPLPSSPSDIWPPSHVFHLLSLKPSITWDQLELLLQIVWNSPWGIKADEMVGGPRGVAVVRDCFEGIGALSLALLEHRRRKEAQSWTDAFLAKVKERKTVVEAQAMQENLNNPWSPQASISRQLPNQLSIDNSDLSFDKPPTFGLPPSAFYDDSSPFHDDPSSSFDALLPTAQPQTTLTSAPTFWGPLPPHSLPHHYDPYPSPIHDSPPHIPIARLLPPPTDQPRPPTPGTALATQTGTLSLSPTLKPRILPQAVHKSPSPAPHPSPRYPVGTAVMTEFERFGAWPTIILPTNGPNEWWRACINGVQEPDSYLVKGIPAGADWEWVSPTRVFPASTAPLKTPSHWANGEVPDKSDTKLYNEALEILRDPSKLAEWSSLILHQEALMLRRIVDGERRAEEKRAKEAKVEKRRAKERERDRKGKGMETGARKDKEGKEGKKKEKGRAIEVLVIPDSEAESDGEVVQVAKKRKR